MAKFCFEVLNEAFCRDAEAFSEPSEKDLEWQNKMTTTEWVEIFSSLNSRFEQSSLLSRFATNENPPGNVWYIFQKPFQATPNFSHNAGGGQT